MLEQQKLFVVSLPRTATTSFCLAMIEQGFKVAHTAYTLEAFKNANVIADTPVFNDYAALDKIYPQAKFVYIERDAEQWLVSIRQLLSRMKNNLQRSDGGFNPILKRCYTQVFGHFSDSDLNSDQYLLDCFYRHQQQVTEYFSAREQDFVRFNPDDNNWWQKIAQLSSQPMTKAPFPHVNIGAKVTSWNELKHPLKVDSTRNGRCDDLTVQLYR
ncbi:sulfotransferase family protein [Thalassotalea litorea]|uniref:Sulfotransferase family protein n=2 Tax=Thalassotalea litorea TaxID=2020715 RepID=A0A5R9IS81_9GAMM|nr:sulfotransferase family protein [Thalassotalea litorea]